MNYRLLLLFTLASSSLYAQEENQAAPAAEETATVQTVNAEQQMQDVKPESEKPFSITESFYHFIRVFVALLNSDSIHNSTKALEAMFANLMQTAYQIIQNTKTSVMTRDGFALSPELLEELEKIIRKESKLISIKRAHAHHHHHGPDEQTQRILANFAGVVQHFFNILQDPENKEVVGPSILGMITGMINIGAEAMKKDGPPLQANRDAFEKYVRRFFDEEMKENMLRIIMSAQEQSGILIGK